MRSGSWSRLGLALLAANQLLIGSWASLAPKSFYADFPTGAGWVALLPPFNEHLVRDVGGLSLGFAVLFTAATIHPYRPVVRIVLWAWLTAAIPHMAFHLTHLDGFTLTDAVAQSLGLAIVVVIPIGILASERARSEGRPGHGYHGDGGAGPAPDGR